MVSKVEHFGVSRSSVTDASSPLKDFLDSTAPLQTGTKVLHSPTLHSIYMLTTM